MMLLGPIIAAVMTTLAITPAMATASCCFVPDRAYQKKILSQYIQTWNGDVNLAYSTFSPSVSLHQDRIPLPVGSMEVDVHSAEAFRNFIVKSRAPWSNYTFEKVNWAGDGNNVVLRWTMVGVIGPNFTIPTTLKAGDSITYNGTDWLRLDECTGLIKQVDSSQDFISLLHNLGNSYTTV